jgi:hypothetical protein
VEGDACEENAVKHPAYDAVCLFKLLWFSWLLIYVFDKAYHGGIDCGWSGDTQHGCCCDMARPTGVAGRV